MVRQYQLYLDSNIEVTNFNFENEIFKQTEGISQIKFLLKQNGVKLDSIENQTATPDTCLAAPMYKKIVALMSNTCLKQFIITMEKVKKSFLSGGLGVVKNSFPFNEKRFGYLFKSKSALLFT